MQKILLFITNSFDAKVAVKHLKKSKSHENTIIVATSIEARLAADMCGLRYKSYEDIASGLERKNIVAQARDYSYRVFADKTLRTLTKTQVDVSLVEMQFTEILGIFYELLMAKSFVTRILEIEQPDLILIPYRKNILLQDMPYWNIQCPNGLETEVLLDIAKSKNIDYRVYYSLKDKVYYNKFWYFLNLLFKYPRRFVNANRKQYLKVQRIANLSNELIYDKTIMFYAWGGYYFKQNISTIEALLLHKINLVLVIIGGEDINDSEFAILRQYKNLNIIYQDNVIEAIGDVNLRIKRNKIFKSVKYLLQDDPIVSKLFTFALYSMNSKRNVKTWLANEFLIKKYKPSVLYSHFNYLIDILSYRKYGIPTITGCHGFYTYLNFPLEIISAEYFAVQGDIYRNPYCSFYENQANKLVSVGEESFYDIYNDIYDRNEYRLKYDIPENMSVCVLCDNSTFKFPTYYDRHLTYPFLKMSENLAKDFPNVMFYIRIHHGYSYGYLEEYFKNLKVPNLKLSLSPNPLFRDFVKCANVTISHFSSAIIESVLSGVPVIYDTKGFDVCKDLVGLPNIYPVNNYDSLKQNLCRVLQEHRPIIKVREDMKEFINNTYEGGLKNLNSDVLARYIISLMDVPSEKGWKDYEDRIKLAAYEYQNFIEKYYNVRRDIC